MPAGFVSGVEVTHPDKGTECYGMWVLTDDGNAAAVASYTSAGATRESAHVLFEWKFER